jgi:hypothetical protein
MMRALDLFCGNGLVSWGLWQSGRFHEVVGVDIVDMSNVYAFDFIQQDALSLDYEFLMSFDFIWASPPCQAYSKRTPDKNIHPRLISKTRGMLFASGVPYVVENVEGSGKELKPNLRIRGYNVGLPMDRVRYFHLNPSPGTHNQMSTRQLSNDDTGYLSEDNTGYLSMSSAAAAHVVIDPPNISGSDTTNVSLHGGGYVARGAIIDAMGLSSIPDCHLKRISVDGMKQGIPPIMAKWIVEQVLPHKAMIG